MRKDAGYVKERFGVAPTTGFQPFYHHSFHSSPPLPVISTENPTVLSLYHWGLIPSWIRDRERGEEFRKNTGNARAESVFEKPSFRDAIRERRCLVIADGFFEWQEVDGKNYPYYIRLKSDEAFAFAGIWDQGGYSGSEKTFSLITTRANELLEAVHNKKKRMPVILEKKSEKRWLDPDFTREEMENMLVPYVEEEMVAHTVGRLISQRGKDNNVPGVIEPYEYPELNTRQTKLF